MGHRAGAADRHARIAANPRGQRGGRGDRVDRVGRDTDGVAVLLEHVGLAVGSHERPAIASLEHRELEIRGRAAGRERLPVAGKLTANRREDGGVARLVGDVLVGLGRVIQVRSGDLSALTADRHVEQEVALRVRQDLHAAARGCEHALVGMGDERRNVVAHLVKRQRQADRHRHAGVVAERRGQRRGRGHGVDGRRVFRDDRDTLRLDAVARGKRTITVDAGLDHRADLVLGVYAGTTHADTASRAAADRHGAGEDERVDRLLAPGFD